MTFQLTNLDVSNNVLLTFLDCNMNQLTSLDVSNNVSLTYLSCYGNQITSIDVGNCTKLKDFICDKSVQINGVDESITKLLLVNS